MLEINTARIVNTVEFRVNEKSLEKAKSAGKRYQKEMEKMVNPTLKATNAKKQMDQMADVITANKKKQAKTDAALSAKQAKLDAQNKMKADKAVRAQTIRSEKAEIKRQQAFRQLQGVKNGRMGDGMSTKKYYETLQYLKLQTAEYEKGNISQAKMNHLIRDRITLERRAAAVQSRQISANGGKYPHTAKQLKNGAVSSGGAGLMVSGMTGGIIGGAVVGAGAMAAHKVGQDAQERINLVRMSDRVRADANQIAVMRNWGQQNGVDSANTDKLTDNVKDLNEKIGNTINKVEWDSKKGAWKGGEGSVTDVMNTLGWNKNKLKSYQGRPLQMAQDIVSEGERRGMTKDQIMALLEPLADDLGHYLEIFSRGGKQFNEMMEDLKRNGQYLSEADKELYRQAGKTSAAFSNLTDGLSNQAFIGFMEAIKNMPALKPEEGKALQDAAYGVGSSFGDLAKQGAVLLTSISSFGNELTGWINKHLSNGPDDKRPETQKVMDAAVEGKWSPATIVNEGIRYATGLDTKDVGRIVRGEETQSGVPGWWTDLINGNKNLYSKDSLIGNKSEAYRPNVPLAAPPVNVTANIQAPSDLVTVKIVPDGNAFSRIVRSEIQENNRAFSTNLILNTLSGQSNK